MKMFYFNPNDYGEEYFVMANNREDAIQYLLNYLATEASTYPEKALCANGIDTYEPCAWSEYKAWVLATTEGKLVGGYTCEEYTEGQVVRTEIC